MKIGILIPTTTKGTKAKSITDTLLFKYLIPSLLNTLSTEHTYNLYLAIDDNDKIYSKLQSQKKIKNKDTYTRISRNIKLNPKIISTKGIEKGNVVGYWNMLFKKAYNDNCDYFIQSGDDIVFWDSNWLELCIHHLKLNNGYGAVAPVDLGNPSIMTQSVVSRRHMDIFGYYYPPELKSWFCDNWITDVYGKTFCVFARARLQNRGGEPRYIPPDWDITKKLCKDLVNRDNIILKDYINKLCIS